MDSTLQDQLLIDICNVFLDNTIDGNWIEWERVEPYAIDDNARLKRASIGVVDQGQRFGYKASTTDNQWRLAVEWYVHAERNEDPQTFNNQARAHVFRTMSNMRLLVDGVIDVSPVMDDVMVERGENWGEGVMIFDVRYRTRTNDINQAL